MTIINLLYFFGGIIITLIGLIIISIIIAWRDFKKRSELLQKYQKILNNHIDELEKNK